MGGRDYKEDTMDQVTGFDIPAYNVERAAEFYQQLFGWMTTSHEAGHSHVTTVKMDKNWVPKEKGAVNGGLYKRGKKKATPVTVVTVKSIDKSLVKARKAKGKVITPKTAAGQWGWWAEIRDTEGNIFELWEDAK